MRLRLSEGPSIHQYITRPSRRCVASRREAAGSQLMIGGSDGVALDDDSLIHDSDQCLLRCRSTDNTHVFSNFHAMENNRQLKPIHERTALPFGSFHSVRAGHCGRSRNFSPAACRPLPTRPRSSRIRRPPQGLQRQRYTSQDAVQ